MKPMHPDERVYPLRPIVGVSAVVVGHGKALMVKRAHEPGLGLWSIPGGVVELGERLEEAARREVLEETGLFVRLERMIGVFENVVRDEDGRVKFHYVLVAYLASPVRGNVRASEESLEVRWVDFNEVQGMGTTRTAANIMKMAGLVT